MQLVVFLDDSLILFLKRFVVQSVIGDLTLQSLVDLLQLLKSFGGLQ